MKLLRFISTPGIVSFLLIALLLKQSDVAAQATRPSFQVLVLAENGGHHIAYSTRARPWLDKLARDSGFQVTYLTNTDSINAGFLRRFQLFIQLDYPPYAWKDSAVKAFEEYISTGTGGWLGFHHASLLGEFDGYPLWNWFYHFMGSIRFTDYITGFADGLVKTEDANHPVMKGIPTEFVIKQEEWYTYDKSPRSAVHVIASVNENTYMPASNKKMGDHPVIWSNPSMKARNVYIFMGHSPALFDDPHYCRLFRNAIFWAAGRTEF